MSKTVWIGNTEWYPFYYLSNEELDCRDAVIIDDDLYWRITRHEEEFDKIQSILRNLENGDE